MVTKFRKIKKERHQSIFFSVVLGVLIFVVVGFLVVSNFKMGQKRTELNSRIENLRKEIQILEEKHETLQAQISETSKEYYLEKEARERFNLKKPGEEVVTILPQEEAEEGQKERKWWNPFTW